MKIICFSGNLGNQIFYCAFKDYLKRKYKTDDIYYFVMHNCPKVCVDKYFSIDLPKQSLWVDIISFLVFYGDIFFYKIFRRNVLKSILCSRGKIEECSIFFSNYLQDKYYYENEDSSWLKIKKPSSLSNEFKKFQQLIKYTNSICIHIRRGDYIKPNSAYVDLSSTDYYDKAIEYAKKCVPNAKLFFFSDDLEFVKNKYSYDNSYYVDCNRGENSYLDIELMSLAKVNIMANSTFSYWGAYMRHENKIVIYPKLWFNDFTGRNAPNIMLNSWIGI